jgi:hypothetical protein
MYILRSMGEDTFDMGPGAKICIAAANGSTVGMTVSSGDSVKTGSRVGIAGVSVGEGISSGVDVGDAIVDSVAVGRTTVTVDIESVMVAGKGDICSSIQGGGGTSVEAVPQPAMAAARIIKMKNKVMRPINYPARRYGLRAVKV